MTQSTIWVNDVADAAEVHGSQVTFAVLNLVQINKVWEVRMTSVSMTVNGKAVSGEVEGRTLLVDYLREDLRLTGTHVGCDTSQCGACVVHVNGEAVKACTMFAVEADGADVGTIEGQATADGSLNVIQQAYPAHHGLQCGFCTPGASDGSGVTEFSEKSGANFSLKN